MPTLRTCLLWVQVAIGLCLVVLLWFVAAQLQTLQMIDMRQQEIAQRLLMLNVQTTMIEQYAAQHATMREHPMTVESKP